MAQYDRNWLQRPNVSWARVTAICSVWFAVLLLLEQTKFARDIENKLTNPFSFQVRELWRHSPVVSDKIRIFGFDDKTIAWLKTPDLSLELWVKLIDEIDRRHPKAIIIDKMFSMLNGDSDADEKQAHFIDILSKVKSPVIVGAFVAPLKIEFRPTLALDDKIYQLTNWVQVDNTAKNNAGGDTIGYGLGALRSNFVYGPDPRLSGAIKNIGHILYDSDGKFQPILKLENGKVVPHSMLLAADKAYYRDGMMYINGSKVPLFRDGTIFLNFSPFSHYLKKTKSILNNLKRVINSQEVEGIDAGDYVYLIPEFYTGSTDFKQTPFGPMPGGYAHLALLNSIVTGQWIKPLWGYELILLLGCIFGALIATQFNAIGVGVWALLGAVFWIIASLYLFIYHDFLTPWLGPLVGYSLCLITVFFEKSRVTEQKAQFIRCALDGFVSPMQLEKLVNHPEKLNLEARERVVSIMFIDVVGFSLLAKNQLPRIAFDNLKDVLNSISALVHDYGGIVNKNLGDGLLCFFGYSIETDETILNHAERAVECGIQIQKFNLPRTLAAFERGDPVYPLRIGINTSSAYLGNIGTDTNIDFTVIGNGVNFAKRLEGNATPHMLMLGETTRELIAPFSHLDESIQKCFIKIKHYDDLIESYLLNPFYNNPQPFLDAIQAYQISISKVRKQERMDIGTSEKFKIQTGIGPARLLDFSPSSLTIMLPSVLLKGTRLEINIDSFGDVLKDELIKAGIEKVETQVLWGYEEEDGCLHDVRLCGVDVIQAKVINDVLKKAVGFEGSSTEKK